MPLPEPAAAPDPAPAAAATARRLRVAFQGEPGAFSEEAILALWGAAAEPVPVPTFAAVTDAAERGDVDFGLLPIENTLVGSVDTAYDLIAMSDGLAIAAEVVIPVRLSLMALPGATLAGIRTLASHPIMLGQCSYFLDAHPGIQPVPAWDTAGAARDVAESGDLTRAAAGSRRAAERYALQVLADGIEDRPDNQFRFLAVGRESTTIARGAPARTAVLCIFGDAAGSLVSGLTPLAEASFRISHLASRPTRTPWIYQFFIEYDHPAQDPRAAHALRALRASCSESRVLGTYPRWMGGVEAQA